MTHLRRRGYTSYVCSECHEYYPAIKRSDLAFNIEGVTCVKCLEDWRRRATREAAECADRLLELKQSCNSPETEKPSVKNLGPKSDSPQEKGANDGKG